MNDDDIQKPREQVAVLFGPASHMLLLPSDAMSYTSKSCLETLPEDLPGQPLCKADALGPG